MDTYRPKGYVPMDCQYCEWKVPPSKTIETCTHLVVHSGDKVKRDLCKAISVKATCISNSNCDWNSKPSRDASVCTHLLADSGDKEKRDACSKITLKATCK